MSLQEKRLLFAMELSNKNWKVAFGDGSRLRVRDMPAGSEGRLIREVALAKEKLDCPDAREAPDHELCYGSGQHRSAAARSTTKDRPA